MKHSSCWFELLGFFNATVLNALSFLMATHFLLFQTVILLGGQYCVPVQEIDLSTCFVLKLVSNSAEFNPGWSCVNFAGLDSEY